MFLCNYIGLIFEDISVIKKLFNHFKRRQDLILSFGPFLNSISSYQGSKNTDEGLVKSLLNFFIIGQDTLTIL